jgi:hypothetical protein
MPGTQPRFVAVRVADRFCVIDISCAEMLPVFCAEMLAVCCGVAERVGKSAFSVLSLACERYIGCSTTLPRLEAIGSCASRQSINLKHVALEGCLRHVAREGCIKLVLAGDLEYVLQSRSLF